MIPPERLIAHRGWPARYPENTLPGIAAVIEAGARFVEIDVQMTADGVVVLMHDADLVRTTGVEASVLDVTRAALQAMTAGEPARFGDMFSAVTAPTLADVAAVLATTPDVTLFVEIKPVSLERFGVGPVVDAVLGDLAACPDAVIISFTPEALLAVRGVRPIGSILPEWSAGNLATAASLAPAYLFCDHRKLPADAAPLPGGAWRWAIYEVADVDHARSLLARGVDLVETMRWGVMRSLP